MHQANATATSPPSHQSIDSNPINLNNIQLIPLEADISDISLNESLLGELFPQACDFNSSVFCANDEGVANIIPGPSGDAPVFFANDDEVATTPDPSPEIIDNMWDSAVTSIFLPPQPEKKENKAKPSKTVTHRLLTSEEIISIKRDLVEKKNKKEEQVQARKLKKVKSKK